MHPYFYFEAQTGSIYETPPQVPSNFYRYTFFRRHLPKVQAIVDRANVGPSGLEYSPEDLRWLEANEIDRPGGFIPRPARVNR